MIIYYYDVDNEPAAHTSIMSSHGLVAGCNCLCELSEFISSSTSITVHTDQYILHGHLREHKNESSE